MFISSHALSDIEHLCDRATILVQGEIRKEVLLQDVSHAHSTRNYEVLLEVPAHLSQYSWCLENLHPEQQGSLWKCICQNREEAQALIDKARGQGAMLEQCLAVHERLEDIFIDTVQGKSDT
jgi:ABC-type uncharacterized transport system ATPase subunit